MEYDGLVVRYPVDRPLTDEERARRLEPCVPTSFPPSAFPTVIAKNDGFLELVDKYYAWKGALSGVFLGPLLAFGWVVAGFPSAVATGLAKTPVSERWLGWLAGGFGVAVGVAIMALLGWLVLRESFTQTHFPIRFNRRNRMVYVFRPRRRPDILRVKWDDVFWHIRHNKNRQFGSYNWFVAGHVMAKDRKTVLETFAFGHMGSSPEEVYPQWEYVRRFMESGAGAVPEPEIYLPIKHRKEGFWWGAQMLLLNTPANALASMLLLPFTAIGALARWLCMLTNRVPVWPADIEAACGHAAIEPAGSEAPPERMKILALVVVGLLVDAALISWALGLSSR